MRARLVALAALGALSASACAAAPAPAARPPSASSLEPVPPDLASAEARWRAAPSELDAIVWYGRRTAYTGRFEDALAIYDEGLRLHPGEPELLRHRGHRLLSLRRFAEARADLEQAALALAGTSDRLELDGAPNAFDIPRGTLHTNVWYHLGLAYHLLAQDELAAQAFARCLALAPNDDFRVAAAYWRALALFHLGRSDAARELAAFYAGRPLELMESGDYALLLAYLAGTSTAAESELAASAADVAQATLAYGVAMGLRLQGREAEARARLAALVAAPPSSAFGRLAAEVELARLGPEEAAWTLLFDGAQAATSLANWAVSEFGGQGEIEPVEGGVRLGMGSMLTGIHYPRADELPRSDYELEVVAARLQGSDFFCGLTFPVGDAHLTLVLGGWGGALTGLSCLDGRDASDNETRSFRRYEKGRDYRVRVRVRPTRVEAWIDGEPVVAADLAGRKLGLRPEIERSRPLGFACYATVARLRSLALRRLAPEG